MNEDCRQQKNAIRCKTLALRDAMDKREHEEKSRLVSIALQRLLEQRTAETGTEKPILFYAPFRSEADIWPVIEWAWRREIPVLFPRAERPGRTMRLYRVRRRADLAPGGYGIPEPLPRLPEWTDWRQIGHVIVPGIAYDLRGGRIGYGAGYYDRFFSEMAIRAGRTEQAMPERIAPAFELQLYPEIPQEPSDWRVHTIVTESRLVSLPKED